MIIQSDKMCEINFQSLMDVPRCEVPKFAFTENILNFLLLQTRDEVDARKCEFLRNLVINSRATNFTISKDN